MSEYILLFRSSADEQREVIGTPEKAQRALEGWMKWVASLEAKGQLKRKGDALDQRGKVVRADKRVTDGPFIEVKDLVLGYMVVEAPDLDAAAEIAAGCPIVVGGGGSVEVRPIHGLEG